jgi:hypothetical protein
VSDRIHKTVLLVDRNSHETQSIGEMIQHPGSQVFELTHVDNVREAKT